MLAATCFSSTMTRTVSSATGLAQPFGARLQIIDAVREVLRAFRVNDSPNPSTEPLI